MHSGFEHLGAELGRKARRRYPLGWTYVLGVYAGRHGPLMLLLSGLTALGAALQRASTPAAAGARSPEQA